MLTITTDTLPPGYELIEVLGMVETTSRIEISNKGIIRNLTERGRNEHQEAYNEFINGAMQLRGKDQMPGNLAYGVRVSTTTAQFGTTVYLLMTYCGTVARVKAPTS